MSEAPPGNFTQPAVTQELVASHGITPEEFQQIAKMLGRDDLGRLQKGAKADIAIINLRDIAFGAVRDPIRSLTETAVSRDVRGVIVDGETLVDDGTYKRLNEEELLEKVQVKGEQVWDSVPKWHWTGKSIDQVVPPSFRMK